VNAGVRAAFALLALAAATAGCAHLVGGGAPPGPTPVPSSTPAPCGTPVPGALFVAMASYITATTDPTYGLINGYALVAQDGTYSNVAQPIRVRPGDSVQFVDVEPSTLTGQPSVEHSAAGLQSGASFPAATFPPAAQVATGTVIGNGSWSTGRVPALPTTLCYSQAFGTPAAGTFSFGDLDFYTTTNMRDVIVVTPSAPR
jgi:hypothetical protein